ncbi:hypothetical protein B0T10DRAFT_319964 [Thelonectria olida]|uniref:Uncharacterized protein n=1 Tax=Thelonectria olida TaxID=1576542 RepID=A0A9P8W5Y7_9HYPO|nr:hypothetical protein B0T10DRAFT_319964 [Thelonectria olida]
MDSTDAGVGAYVGAVVRTEDVRDVVFRTDTEDLEIQPKMVERMSVVWMGGFCRNTVRTCRNTRKYLLRFVSCFFPLSFFSRSKFAIHSQPHRQSSSCCHWTLENGRTLGPSLLRPDAASPRWCRPICKISRRAMKKGEGTGGTVILFNSRRRVFLISPRLSESRSRALSTRPSAPRSPTPNEEKSRRRVLAGCIYLLGGFFSNVFKHMPSRTPRLCCSYTLHLLTRCDVL